MSAPHSLWVEIVAAPIMGALLMFSFNYWRRLGNPEDQVHRFFADRSPGLLKFLRVTMPIWMVGMGFNFVMVVAILAVSALSLFR